MTSFSVSKLKIHIIRVGLRMWIFELYDREWRHSQVQTVLSFYIQLTKPYKIQLFSITSEILGPSISTVPTLNIHFWNFSLWLQHYDCSFIKRIFDHFDWIFPSKPVWTIPRNNFGNCDFVHIWFSFFSWFRIWFPIFPRFTPLLILRNFWSKKYVSKLKWIIKNDRSKINDIVFLWFWFRNKRISFSKKYSKLFSQ